MVKSRFDYNVKYEKAWKAKQAAFKMFPAPYEKKEHASTNPGRTNPATSIVQMSTYDIWLELWLAN
jgi:hypothetical protein